MFFFCLAIFLPMAWLLPWWTQGLIAVAIGWWQPRPWRGPWSVAWAAGLAAIALTYVNDVANFGLASKHVAAIFSLPAPILIFPLMGALSFITVLVCVQAGMSLRGLIRLQ